MYGYHLMLHISHSPGRAPFVLKLFKVRAANSFIMSKQAVSNAFKLILYVAKSLEGFDTNLHLLVRIGNTRIESDSFLQPMSHP